VLIPGEPPLPARNRHPIESHYERAAWVLSYGWTALVIQPGESVNFKRQRSQRAVAGIKGFFRRGRKRVGLAQYISLFTGLAQATKLDLRRPLPFLDSPDGPAHIAAMLQRQLPDQSAGGNHRGATQPQNPQLLVQRLEQ
jgi:hypothetical protein